MSAVEFALRVGDDALVAAQRLAQWSAKAPEMEEDVAMANIALDQLGVARSMLTYAGELEGDGRDEDTLAFRRPASEFRNCLLVELPDSGDFGVAMAKLLFLSAYQVLLYDHLAGSPEDHLAGVGGKARKESAYHLDHAALWTVRLGDGTAESHRRMQSAVTDIWPYTFELFEDSPIARPQWADTVDGVLAEATLTVPAATSGPTGGRQGRHTEHLTELLAEMQSLHRAHPDARW